MLQPVSSEALSAETHVWCRVLETDMSSVQKDEEDDDLLLCIDTNAPQQLATCREATCELFMKLCHWSYE